jgi:hypothetical protein
MTIPIPYKGASAVHSRVQNIDRPWEIQNRLAPGVSERA